MDAPALGLGQGFTPEMRSAWAKVYGVLAATMQAGAQEVAELARQNELGEYLQKAAAELAPARAGELRPLLMKALGKTLRRGNAMTVRPDPVLPRYPKLL